MPPSATLYRGITEGGYRFVFQNNELEKVLYTVYKSISNLPISLVLSKPSL